MRKGKRLLNGLNQRVDLEDFNDLKACTICKKNFLPIDEELGSKMAVLASCQLPNCPQAMTI